LPAGLALDGATGVIAGTPRFIGTYRFTVEARNGYGCGDSRSYALRVSF
jgi:large repetitive protein